MYFSFNSESGSAATLEVQPDYDDAGFYPLNIIVTDKAGATDTFSFNLTVNDTNNNPVIDFAQFLSSDDTTIYKFAGDTVIFDVDAVDPDIAVFGDQINFEILSGPEWLNINPQTGLISGTVPQDASGVTAVEVMVSDMGGASDISTFNFTLLSNEVNFLDPSFIGNFEVGEQIQPIVEIIDPDGHSNGYTGFPVV